MTAERFGRGHSSNLFTFAELETTLKQKLCLRFKVGHTFVVNFVCFRWHLHVAATTQKHLFSLQFCFELSLQLWRDD